MLSLPLLFACQDPTPPSPTSETGTGTPTVGTGSATCTLAKDNALRATCAVSLAEPGTVEIELTDGERAVLFTDDAVVRDHTIPLWGMTPETTWTYTVRGEGLESSGTITTGSLPPEVSFSVQMMGEGEIVTKMILAPLACDAESWAVVLDLDGNVWWYQRLQPTPEAELLVKALMWGDDDQVLALLGPKQVASFDLSGQNTMRATSPYFVHHDVFRLDGITYALMAEEYTEEDGYQYVEDVIGGMDAKGNLAYLFETHDNLGADPPAGPPSPFWGAEFPGATDAWHSNGIYVTPDQDVYLSMKRVNTVVKIARDTLEWVLTGDGQSTYLATDFTMKGAPMIADPTFAEQHHPALLPNGHLTLFDNSVPRGLQLEIDEQEMTATYVNSWEIDGPCLFEGSVYPLDDGHWLLTCANTHEFWEFDAKGALARRVGPVCDAGELPLITHRGVPVDLWNAHVGTVRSTRVEP